MLFYDLINGVIIIHKLIYISSSAYIENLIMKYFNYTYRIEKTLHKSKWTY